MRHRQLIAFLRQAQDRRAIGVQNGQRRLLLTAGQGKPHTLFPGKERAMIQVREMSLEGFARVLRAIECSATLLMKSRDIAGGDFGGSEGRA